jgi:hypothetical protein
LELDSIAPLVRPKATIVPIKTLEAWLRSGGAEDEVFDSLPGEDLAELLDQPKAQATLSLRCWVINLARSKDRWAALAPQCAAQQLRVERWEATDGRALGVAGLLARGAIAPNADFLRRPNAAAVGGICDSTAALWRHLAALPPAEQRDWHLILEDDVVLPPALLAQLDAAWPLLPADAEVALLGCDFWQRGSAERDAARFAQSLRRCGTSPSPSSPSMPSPPSPWWRVVALVGGGFAYAVRSAALPKLLQLTPFRYAFDNWPHGLACYLLDPIAQPHYQEGMAFYGIVRCSGAPSTVQLAPQALAQLAFAQAAARQAAQRARPDTQT